MKRFLMPRGAGDLTNGEQNYNNSPGRAPKRNPHSLMEDTGLDLLGNKKPALEAINRRPVLGISNMNVSPWDGNSSFQSIYTQYSNSLFGSERAVNLVDRNILPARSGLLNSVTKDFEEEYLNGHSMGLSTSHISEDPSCLNIGGIRNLHVIQDKESDNGMPIPKGNSNCPIERNINLMLANCTDSNTISLGPKFNENTISRGHSCGKADGNFRLMGQNINKGDDSLMGHNYDKQKGILSIGQAFDKGVGNSFLMGLPHEKRNGSVISMGSSYNMGHGNYFSLVPAYSKVRENFENFSSNDPSSSEGNNNIIPMATTDSEVNADVVSMVPTSDKGKSSILSMGNEKNAIAVGGLNEESDPILSGEITNSNDLLTSNQNAAQLSEASEQIDSVESTALSIAIENQAKKSKTKRAPKKKEPKQPKKVAPNTFPASVKSLLTTGMFDGVPVKYSSWCREKILKGTIKGNGYLCGCKDCNYSKLLNAFEFESHAGCKTKHPNDHIYFRSGKTVFGVVQELSKTPQDKLFDAIQKIAGCAINQKNFETWKGLYTEASRELQRIYGKDKVIMPSED